MSEQPPVSGRRPPWWPEGEPWPPRGATPFMGTIVRRVALGVVLFLLVGSTLGVLSGFLWGRDRGAGPPIFVPIFWLVVLVILLLVGRRFTRSYARPMNSVLDVIGRLAGGDYSARARPAGPPPMRSVAEAVNTMATRLEAAEEQRRALLADIAHEVRTPLAIIRGNVEGMLDGVYPPSEARLTPILEEVDVITRLVEDLQTLSSAEAGMLKLHLEPVELAALVEDVVNSFEPQANAKGVALRRRAAPVPSISLDPTRMRQVLENLLSNALRHTDDGGSIEVAVGSPSAARVEVEVTDTGSGIAPEDLPHIFERYRKTPDSGGSGLGLAIARGLVEAHGGTISAASQVGHGTRIWFTLPVEER